MKKRNKGLLPVLVHRSKSRTPKFFRRLRTLGLTLTAVGSVFVAAPVPLPDPMVTFAGYLVVAGGVLSAVCQVTVEDEACFEKRKPNVQPQKTHDERQQ